MMNHSIPGPGTVLVVEDEPLVRTMFAEELRHGGYPVHEAANAAEALSILRSSAGTRIRLLLTDLRMPGALDGGDLVHRVRADYPALKVVMVSAESPEPSVRHELDRYFAKPCNIAQLMICMQMLLG
jgi:CheY-like chemotaxis protein